MATVDRLVRAAGLAVAWRLVPLDAPVVATAMGIEASLRRGDPAEALRHVAELVAELDQPTSPDQQAAVLAVEPPTTGDRRWDALLAGVVEWLAHRQAVRTPAWTAEPDRFLGVVVRVALLFVARVRPGARARRAGQPGRLPPRRFAAERVTVAAG